MANYRIKFESVGIYKEGDVVSGPMLGDTAYLLRVGAVEETEEPEKVQTSITDVTSKIEEAVAKATAAMAEEIDDLQEKLKKSGGSAAAKKQIEELTKKNEELMSQVVDLQKRIDEMTEIEVPE